jgi:DNA-directed RNA polymerase specialized sigma subunit
LLLWRDLTAFDTGFDQFGKPNATALCRRAARPNELLSAGVPGLIHAIDNFDPTQNVKLRTYTEYRIRGAILDSLRACDRAPRMKRRLARTLQAGLQKAEQRWGTRRRHVEDS